MPLRIAGPARAALLSLVVTASVVATALAQTAAPAPAGRPPSAVPAPAGEPGVGVLPAGAPGRRLGGYLGLANLPDHAAFLPPPPAVDSVLGKADVAIFEQTRKLENGPRWQLATSDDRIDRKSMLGNFSCAIGLDLSSAETPALSRVLIRSGADLFPVIGAAKDAYQRPRPFVMQVGPICITPSEDFAHSGSYPSGHAASGWLYALLLAEIDPEHATAVINRGRAFGESRVVCGVHYLSDIEGGRLTASALVAELHGTPEFETDVAAARAELTGLRSGAARPAATACDTEGANLAKPW